MSKTAVITARLDEETMALVDRVAAAQGRSRAWFAAQAIRRIAEDEAAYMAFVEEGIDALDRGDTISHDDLFAKLRAKRGRRNAA